MSVRHRPRPSQLVVQRRALSQAVPYLSWLDSAHHEFEALVRQVLGAEAAESIDRRRPQMVCIAAVSPTTTGWPCSGCPSGSTWCATASSMAAC